jgi:hypothetical protein
VTFYVKKERDPNIFHHGSYIKRRMKNKKLPVPFFLLLMVSGASTVLIVKKIGTGNSSWIRKIIYPESRGLKVPDLGSSTLLQE